MELQKYEQEHLDILRPLLPECTVLLKKNGDFPLGKPGKIALYGNGVRKTVKRRNWVWRGEFPIL